MPYCPHCGTESAQSDQRFCQSCGQTLTTTAAPVVPPGTTPATEYQVIGGPVTPEPPNVAARSVGRILAAAAVVVALTGGAFLAYTVFFDKAGGKDPREAVSRLFAAVADQDGVEAIRMLNPGETEGFDDLYGSLQKRIAAAGLASDDSDKVLEAIDIKLKDLELDVQERGDNAARVYIVDGRLTITIDGDALPEQYRDLYDDLDADVIGELKDLDISEVLQDAGAEGEIFLTTIKRDGRWYVSPTATAGEYLLADEDFAPLTAADFDKVAESNAPKPETSASPEGALIVLADAVSSGRIEEIFAALPEDEVAALRPFTEVLQEQLDNTDDTELTVSDLETDFEELDDDLGKLTIKRGRLAGTVDGDEGSLEIDGICVISRDTGDRADTGSPDGKDCLPDEIADQTGIDSIWVILRKESGGWQIDPRATLISYATSAIDNLDEDFLEEALNEGFLPSGQDDFPYGEGYSEEGSTTF